MKKKQKKRPKQMQVKLRDKISSGLGCVLEWYDFAIYGYFASIIATQFFPYDTNIVGYIKAFSIFAIGFLARPIGALYFGHLSDKYGRTVVLKITPFLISFPTLALSLLSTYHQIGIWAPLLLMVLRIIQGICIGGEFSNNIIFLCETASLKHRYFFGSLGACTGSMGIMLASYVASLCFAKLSLPFLQQYGWRIAFGISILLGAFTFYLRRNMQETPVFKSLADEKLCAKNPLHESLIHDYKAYFQAIGLSIFPATAFYFIFIYLPSFATNFLKFQTAAVLTDNSLSLLGRILIIPVIGMITDYVGGLRMARISCLLFITLSLPLFYLGTNKHMNATFIFFTFAFLSTVNAATTPGLLINLLRAKTRSIVFSFTFNFCFGIFGGIVPALCMWLIHITGNSFAPVYYLLATASITLITTYYIPPVYD